MDDDRFSLSNEQYLALCHESLGDSDAELTPAILRTLVAAGHLLVDASGEVLLDGPARAVEEVQADADFALVVRSTRQPEVTYCWVLEDEETLLEQAWSPPGISTFQRRSLDEAVHDLVDGLVPEGSARASLKVSGVVTDEQLQELVDETSGWAHFFITEPPIHLWLVRPVSVDMAEIVLGMDGISPGWLATAGPSEGQFDVRPADRPSVRSLVMTLLAKSSGPDRGGR
jgi:hypothetical protein